MKGRGSILFLGGAFILAALVAAAIAVPIAVDDEEGNGGDIDIKISYDEEITIHPGQDVQFYCVILKNDPSSFLWEWVNGTTISDQQNPIIHFHAPGTYEIILTAGDMELGSDSDSVTIYVVQNATEGGTIGFDREVGMDLPGDDFDRDLSFEQGSLAVSIESYPWPTVIANQSVFFMARLRHQLGFTDVYYSYDWFLWSFDDGDYYFYDWTNFDPENDTCPFCISYGSESYPPGYNISSPAWWSISRTFHTFREAGIYDVSFSIGLNESGELVEISNDTTQINVTRDISLDQSAEDITSRFDVQLIAEPVSGSAPLSVQFTADFTEATPGQTAYTWILGNGIIVTTTTPSINYTYNEPGRYEVELIVRDRMARMFSDRTVIDVIDGDSPVPLITAFPGEYPMTAFLVGDVLNRNDDEVTYRWYFNDELIGESKRITSPVFSFGISTVVLEVEDGNGRKGYDEKTFNFSEDSTPHITDVTVVKSDSDPFLFYFSFEFVGGDPPVEFLWDFGDGTYSNDVSVVHYFPRPDTYTVSLMITDSDDDWDYHSMFVTVVGFEGG